MVKLINKYWLQIVLILMSLTPIIWYIGKSGYLVNGVDTNFPLDPTVWTIRRLFLWNDVPNAGVDHSSSIAGTFFHLVQLIPFLIGVSLQNIQTISFIFWFSLIVYFSYLFSKTIFKDSKLAQILFVDLYTFNIFAFNAWENSKVSTLSLLVGIPFFLNLLTLYIQKEIKIQKFVLLLVIGAIITSGTGINPAYLLSLFLTILIYSIGFMFNVKNRSDIFTIIKGVFISFAVILFTSSFWLLPTFSHILNDINPTASIETIGFTNWVDSLSENTSILNVMRMQGLWDWYTFDGVSGMPLYIPYALNYFRSMPFLIYSFLIPSLVIASFTFWTAKRKNLYISCGLLVILGIFLGAGTHLPTGTFYRFLLNHLPFFSLFRSPWYIFTPLVIVSYASLVSLLFVSDRLSKTISKFGMIILIIGNLIYSYPLITGKIFRPGRYDGFYIKFPQYIFDFKNKLKTLTLNSDKRIIGYPDDEIEQFDWGYRGIESILTLFSSQETLFSPLNNLDAPVSLMTSKFYSFLKKGQLVGALNISDKLNAGYIFDKKDQRSLSPEIFGHAETKKVISEGKWNLFDLGSQAQKIYSPTKFYYSYPYTGNAEALSVVDNASLVLNPEDKVISTVKYISSESGTVVMANNSQAKEFSDMTYSVSKLDSRLTSRDMSKVTYNFKVPREGKYVPILDNYRLKDFDLDIKEIIANLDGNSILLKVTQKDDTFTKFESIQLTTGDHNLVLNIVNRNLVQDKPANEGDAEIKVLGETTTTNTYLSITNTSKEDASMVFKIPDLDFLNPYLIQLHYKQIYGNNGEVLVKQGNTSTLVKSQAERLPNYPDWKAFSFFYEPVKTKSYVSISLVSPQNKDPFGTTILYDDLEIHKVFMNNLFLVEEKNAVDSSLITYIKKSPIRYIGESNGGNKQVIVFSENYSKNWKMRILDNQNNVVPIEPIHFSSNLYANAWYLDNVPGKIKFEIYYVPQKLLIVGYIMSIIVIIGSSIFYLYKNKYD